MLHSIFDNTLKVREEAKKIVLPYESGNETQLYEVGQKVDGYGHGFYTGTIIEVYQENGYFRYVVEYKLKPRSRKKYTQILRQIDIVLI